MLADATKSYFTTLCMYIFIQQPKLYACFDWSLHIYDLLEDRLIYDVTVNLLTSYCITPIDSMLPFMALIFAELLKECSIVK